MTIPSTEKISELRTKIQESLRVQLDTEGIGYIDASNNLDDASAKQNHVIFARRGCGKTLLLHSSSRKVSQNVGTVYLNCEDFKQHSFPNVLIEILRSIFVEIEKHVGGWFGAKRKSKQIISDILLKLNSIQAEQDEVNEQVRNFNSSSSTGTVDLSAALGSDCINIKSGAKSSSQRKEEVEKT
jgi:Cdc6-like AAA superfamily ATPase